MGVTRNAFLWFFEEPVRFQQEEIGEVFQVEEREWVWELKHIQEKTV